MLAAGLLLPSACGNKPFQPNAEQVAGAWCSADGDVLTLNADSTFTITHLSLRYAEILLPAEGWIDDYRIQQDYSGKVPSGATGTWKLDLARGDALEYHRSGVVLELKKVGTRTEADTPTMYFDGDKADWGFAVLHGATFWRYFDRCGTEPPPLSPAVPTPTGWPTAS